MYPSGHPAHSPTPPHAPATPDGPPTTQVRHVEIERISAGLYQIEVVARLTARDAGVLLRGQALELSALGSRFRVVLLPFPTAPSSS